MTRKEYIEHHGEKLLHNLIEAYFNQLPYFVTSEWDMGTYENKFTVTTDEILAYIDSTLKGSFYLDRTIVQSVIQESDEIYITKNIKLEIKKRED